MKKKEKIRTCIATHRTVSVDDLIRFVMDPQGDVIPDLKEKLPGRGVWVTNNKQTIRKTIQQNLFAAGFKKKVRINSDVLQNIGTFLLADIQQGLSMAKKTGAVTTGFFKVESLARRGNIDILFHACDGRKDGMEKIKSALVACQRNGGYEKGLPMLFDGLNSARIDTALGTGNAVHVAIVKSNVTDSLKKKIGRFASYLQ